MAFGSLTFTWNANAEADLAGYRIKYGPAPNATAFSVDVGLTATPATPSIVLTSFQRYGALAFALTAYDVTGNESAPSATVLANVAPKLRPKSWP